MISGLFINSSSINGTQIRLQNGQYLRGRNAANSADVDLLRINSSNLIEFAATPIVSGQGPLALQSEIADVDGIVEEISDEIEALSLTVSGFSTDIGYLQVISEEFEEDIEELQDQVVIPYKETYTISGAPIVTDIEIILDHTPKAMSMLAVVQGITVLTEDVDYEVIANTVTLLSASPVYSTLVDGDNIIFQYLY